MGRRFTLHLCGIVAILVGASRASAGGDSNRLPGGVSTNVVVNHDGAVFAWSERGVYVSQGDLKSWTLFPGDVSEDEWVADLADGTAGNPIVITELAGKNRLWRLSGDDPATMLLAHVDKASFYSDVLGCASLENWLRLTVDGGKTWSQPVKAFSKPEDVFSIKWISEHEIVVTGNGLGVRDYAVDHAIGKVRWSTTMPSHPCYVQSCGADRLAVLWNSLSILSLTDGHQIAVCKPDIQMEYCSIHDPNVVFYGHHEISTWTWDGKVFAHQNTIAKTPFILAVAAVAPGTIAFTEDGLFRVDGARLVPWPITVAQTPIATKQLEPPADKATDQELADFGKWSDRVERGARIRVAEEAAKKNDLNPRQQLLWATEQYKLIVAGQNAPPTSDAAIRSPVTQPDEMSKAELDDAIAWARKVDTATRRPIMQQAFRRKDLSDRQKWQMIKEQCRLAVEAKERSATKPTTKNAGP